MRLALLVYRMIAFFLGRKPGGIEIKDSSKFNDECGDWQAATSARRHRLRASGVILQPLSHPSEHQSRLC
jgi:hypothetical protein